MSKQIPPEEPRTPTNAARRPIALFAITAERNHGAYLGDAFVWKDRHARLYLGRCDDSLQLAQRVASVSTIGEYVALGLADGETVLTPARHWRIIEAGLQ